jgi:hypothetical protein
VISSDADAHHESDEDPNESDRGKDKFRRPGRVAKTFSLDDVQEGLHGNELWLY